MWQLRSPLNKGKQEQAIDPFHTPLTLFSPPRHALQLWRLSHAKFPIHLCDKVA